MMHVGFIFVFWEGRCGSIFRNFGRILGKHDDVVGSRHFDIARKVNVITFFKTTKNLHDLHGLKKYKGGFEEGGL
jgi:hypothetical protein